MEEVLFETRRHASRPCSNNYPPQLPHQLNEGVKSRLLSLLSTRGVSQLKEKWSAYRRPRKLRKWVSLFVSPMGEHVAVAVGNHLTILQKDDEYQEPCGLFTCDSLGPFTVGTWSESHGILGVVDDKDIIYFIKANGEEITRITKKHLKVTFPIAGLIAHNEAAMDKSGLCIFNVLTSDGSFHEVEISQEPSVSSLSALTSTNGSLKEFPRNIFCFDYHYGMSLFAVVGGTDSVSGSAEHSGTYVLSVWQQTGRSDMELISSTQFKGLYSKPNDHVGRLTSPKVQISPEGQFVAALDLSGSLSIFKLDKNSSVSNLFCGNRYDLLQKSDLVDFAWWSDHVLVIAKRSGVLIMIDALTGGILFQKVHVYSLPILQSPQQFQGYLFLLENLSRNNSSDTMRTSDSQPIDLVTDDENYLFDFTNLWWSLLSFSKRSVSEMYAILICEQKYQAALDFANVHGLDKDKVLKSQWLHSSMGTKEISMFLSAIKDQVFVLSECVDKVGPTEDATRALISHGLRITNNFRFSETNTSENSQLWDFRVARLKLLQFRDKLETFLGINMGRFSVQDYVRFRSIPVNEASVRLAENGKIGALNLIFKRHPYSSAPFMLEILASIPETVPVQSYRQLLPGNSPPLSVALREKDWVECRDMVTYINTLGEDYKNSIRLTTEPIAKLSLGFSWPSPDELCTWYKVRAREMDSLSGQLDNSLCLVDFACQKGIDALQRFHEDVSYLHQLIYSDEPNDELNFSMSLVAWEQLPDYEKFKIMLKGVKEENVLERLHKKAIPFMQSRFLGSADSFVVRWLKEMASENKLEICLKVIEEGGQDPENSGIFGNKAEAVECALQCIYLCTSTDKWNTMSSILSKLIEIRGPELSRDGIRNRLKLAEGHVEAGRLLAVYQVPKPINFFLEEQFEGKGVKQILRLLLSKFVRRQPGRSDSDWANLWRDFQSLQEKAFTFLDKEYMLMEFCRGLLKAGKFSLARNYLRGTASVALSTDKAENLVIQAAREYFFSASSLTSQEIWKAKECLNLLPNSRNVRVEADIIDALTVKLPNLGVNILPLQFRQIKDPMEIIRLAITSQVGAYLNVDEIIEVAKLLGLNSQDEISAVQEAIAREAAVAGDLQLAFDLCLVLAKKQHGSIWDLCAAMARGADIENVDISSRKKLLGFALSYCDEQSIGELLHAWKDIDMQDQCEKLITLTGTAPKFEDLFDLRNRSDHVSELNFNNQEGHLKEITSVLSRVAKDLSKMNNDSDLGTLLQENGKTYSFAASQLPWLLKLSENGENAKKLYGGSITGNAFISIRTQAVVTILSWLARNGFAPRDDLVSSLAKSIMEPPVTEEEDIIGTSFLLNLVDSFHGVEIIEEQVREREAYNEISTIMSVGMLYSLLHNSMEDCEGSAQRRELLLRKFKEHSSTTSGAIDNFVGAQSSFWREWKRKLEEKKLVADQSRMLEQIIPGVEATRFLSGDSDYRESVLLSHVESVKLEKRFILKDALKLAYTYGLNHKKVLVQYFHSILVSEVWAAEDIRSEISKFKDEVLACSAEVIETLSFSVYPAIDGHDKLRLTIVNGLLANCYNQLEDTKDIPAFPLDTTKLVVGVAQFYEIIGKECHRVSFIKSLNFKNIAGLDGLNFKLLKDEIFANVNEHSIEALATMVDNLHRIYENYISETIVSSQEIYRHYVTSLFNSFEANAVAGADFENPENINNVISGLEQVYDVSKKYLKAIAYPDVLDFVKRFFTVIISFNECLNCLSTDSTCRDSLVVLAYFWLRVIEDVCELSARESSKGKRNCECLICCLKAFTKLVIEGSVLSSQGWSTVIGFVNHCPKEGFSVENLSFCREMIYSGCRFQAIAEVYHAVFSQLKEEHIQDLLHLYICILDSSLQNLANGSDDHRNLINLLSSLGRADSEVDDLDRVRHAVWERMAKFSDDLTVPNRARVYVLELMQSITASDGRAKGVELESNVTPWENWDHAKSSAFKLEADSNEGVETQTNASTRLTSNLVALRSSQIARPISKNVDITADDLSSVDSAVSCFLRLSGEASSEHHIEALVALLGEWEGLFVSSNKKEDPHSSEPEVAESDWTNDDWDEGWESFQEETVEKEIEQVESRTTHPLHACWIEIFKKMVTLSHFERMIKLIDQSMVKLNGELLDEDDAHNLSEVILGVDSFAALKLALLFPYGAIHTKCLNAVEEKLKEGDTSDAISKDHEFLILTLSSSLISTIISNSSYGTIFSFLSFMVGNLSRQYQEAQLSFLKQKGRNGNGKGNETEYEREILFLFGSLIFPCFVAELVKADQPILAGFLVTKFMHTNASLSLINIAEATLRKYLETQLQFLQNGEHAAQELNFGEPLVNTISVLRDRMENLLQSALLSLTHHSR